MTNEPDDTFTPIGTAAQGVFLALALATMRFADDETIRPERARLNPPFTPAGLPGGGSKRDGAVSACNVGNISRGT